MSDWLYFGCYQGHGHFLYRPGMVQMYERPWSNLQRFDGMLCPLESAPYVASMTRLGAWEMTALGFWDYTIDNRPGSNAIFFAPSLRATPETMLAGAAKFFPEVWARLPEIRLHRTCEEFGR